MQPKCKVTKYSSKEPSLGVVVPCHNNSFQLYGVLKSLVYQTSRPETIVVVDDNSNSYEETKLRSLCRRFGADYKKLPAPQNQLERLGRRSHARNVGTNHLDTDVVLYLDGDMLLPPRYAEEIRFYHRVLPEVYIRGQRFDIPTEYQARGIEACLDAVTTQQIPAAKSSVAYVTCPDDHARQRLFRSVYRDKWEWCASNNLSVRTRYVAEIGYWDENFVGWGEEDIDFSFRLYKLGLTPTILISAAAYHLEHPINHAANIQTLKRNARYLLNKFPEVAPYRDEAYKRYDLNVYDFS